jgi:GxxExxY protein
MQREDDLIERDLVYSIIGAFYDVYNYYGYGLLENVYVAALHQELLDRNHSVEREAKLPIRYKDRHVGWHRADMIVDGKVIVECKATDALPAYTQRQILSYLNATPIEVGVILHFGPEAKYHRYVDTLRNRRRGPYKRS